MSEGTCTCKLQADECDGKHGTFHPFQVGANCTVRACEKTLAHSPIDWQRECDRLRVSLVDADKLIGDLIKERDHRDEIIDKLCDEVLGPDRPEWSSAYGFDDAVSDVEERMAAIKTAPAPAMMAILTTEQKRALLAMSAAPQPLTDEQVDACKESVGWSEQWLEDFARRIEAAVLAKNGITKREAK